MLPEKVEEAWKGPKGEVLPEKGEEAWKGYQGRGFLKKIKIKEEQVREEFRSFVNVQMRLRLGMYWGRLFSSKRQKDKNKRHKRHKISKLKI